MSAPSRSEPEPAPETAAEFRELWRVHYDFVWRSVRRLGIAAPAIDDVVQEVFLAAYRRRDRFEQRASVKTWLFGIALNAVRMHARGELRHRRRIEAVARPEPELAADGERHAAIDLLHHLLDTLDADQRAVFILVELEDVEPKQVAEGLGLSINTVYSRLRLARSRLQRAVQRHQARERRSR